MPDPADSDPANTGAADAASSLALGAADQTVPIVDPSAGATAGAPFASDPSPAPAPAPAALTLSQDVIDALAAAVGAQVAAALPPPAPAPAPAPEPVAAAPTLQAAGLDAVQIGAALLTHQPVPAPQSKALVLMAIAAVIPGLAHLSGATPADLTPWLNGLSLGLAFIAAALGDFTGLSKPKSKA